MLFDSHCHIHSPEFFNAEEAEEAYQSALKQGVEGMLLVATSVADSKAAIAFAHQHPANTWATVGVHPHEASKLNTEQLKEQLHELSLLATDEKVVGVGECGFDFYYNEKSESLANQEALLRGQLDIAQKHHLPLSFHVREAFDEFWRVLEDYQDVQAVLHSFTDQPHHAQNALKRGFYLGINGIATFTNHLWQIEQFKTLPLESIILETDAPFLTPKPKRGTINVPENVTYITNFLAELRGEDATAIAAATTHNSRSLFRL